MATSINKRRRTTTNGSPHISDLPLGFLVDVSAYLSQPSRALFAVAMTAPSSSWADVSMNKLQSQPSEMSKAIISPSSQWEKLDFLDIEKSLANRLTDNDICAILKCINAKDKLKILKLTGCTKIAGTGLEPLRGSIVLEQIDLSLAKQHDRPDVVPSAAKISDEVVIHILDGMIDTAGCSLRYVHFSHQGGRTRTCSVERRAFFRRFGEHLNNSGLDCSKCGREVSAGNTDYLVHFQKNIICYDCLKPICGNCMYAIRNCGMCHKDYCADCVQVNTRCESCFERNCIPCGVMKECDECQRSCCENCIHGPVCDDCERGLTLGDY